MSTPLYRFSCLNTVVFTDRLNTKKDFEKNNVIQLLFEIMKTNSASKKRYSFRNILHPTVVHKQNK